MAPRLSRLTAIAAFGAAVAASAGLAHAQVPGARRVFSREEIGRAGIVRIGGLLRLAPWTGVRTVDEFSWRGGDGATPLEDDRWVLVVDGQLVEPAFLGVTSLARTPLDLHAVDSVAIDVPEVGAFHAGPAAGRVEIFSRRARAGLSAGGRIATGSETGDPGPFAFTPPAVPNQDRFGHDAAFDAAYGSGAWSAAASIGFGVHIATDPAIADRLLATGAGFPRIEYATPSLRLGYAGTGGEHRLLAGRSRVDDWFRVEAVGIELPGRLVLDHAGAAGWFRIGTGARLRYTASAERSEADFLATPVTPSLVLERKGVHAGVAAEFNAAQVGIAAGRRSFSSNRLAADDAYTAFRVFGRVGLTRKVHVAGSIDAALDRVAPALELGAEWEFGSGVWRAVIAASEDVGRPHDALWALRERGFTWLAESGIGVTGAAGGEHRTAKADVRWSRRLGAGLEVAADGSARLRRHAALPFRALAVDTPMSAWRGPITLVPDASSWTGALGAGASWRAARVTIDGEYRLWWLGGDAAARSASRAAPRHGGRMQIAYAPVSSLELVSALAARGPARWEEYGGASIGDVAGAAILDVAVRKTLWDGRIRTHLGLRNLLSAENRWHPEGADDRLSFVLMLDGELGGAISDR